MKIIIYRGSKEIGGTCIQLTADNGKILWIDLGAPLNTINTDTSYRNNKVDALLISHPHQDHFGLMESVGSEVPVYIGQVTLDLINATRIFLGKEIIASHFILINPWQPFTIDDTFTVYPYLMDHSSPEAFAFLIEADGKRVFYSGDIRSTGWKGILFTKLLKAPPRNIDLLLIEGTLVDRTNHPYPTEKSVFKAINAIIRGQQNTTFVISSAQNIDRLVSVVKACNSNKKKLIIDIYNAWVLEMVHKKSKNLPTIDWDNIWVYNQSSQMKKVMGSNFEEFRVRLTKKDIGNSLFHDPQDYVYFLRCPNAKLIDALLPHGAITLIYSQWDGYLRDEHKTYYTDTINKLKDQKKVEFVQIHTSGHAPVKELIELAGAIKPEKIVPIHTENPAKMKQEFNAAGFANVELWEDGKEYSL
jgi:ribonuclease J